MMSVIIIISTLQSSAYSSLKIHNQPTWLTVTCTCVDSTVSIVSLVLQTPDSKPRPPLRNLTPSIRTNEMATLKLKQIEYDLEGLKTFTKPDVKLEQYQTPTRLAAEVLHYIDITDGIAGKTVLDLGCGSGIFTFGCIRLSASRVIGVDIHESAISIAVENMKDLGVDDSSISFVQRNVFDIDASEFPHSDIVIMNPPFGTRSQPNADEKFVCKALEMADIVYSIHKSSTRCHWEQLAMRLKEKWGWNVQVRACLMDQEFTIPRMYKFHKKSEQNILVDLIQFKHQ